MKFDGLNYVEVKQREEKGLVNINDIPKTKSIKQIVLLHTFTLFNILNFFLGLCILLVGRYRNLLFLGVVVCNTVIGIYQEVRAKKIVDKLSLISNKNVKVIRNGKEELIDYEQIVLDDIVVYKIGNQIVADGQILSGTCEVNESFITGEPDVIIKKKGDFVLSGSFLVSGNIITQTKKVGKENYISTISSGAKYIKKTNSEIMDTISKIVKILSICIIPIGTLLFFKQVNACHNYVDATVGTIAALIGMIPEGLILLTSSVFAVSIVRLAKFNVLVQDTYSIESLARIDTLCLDKTGTITEGVMEVFDLVPYKGFTKSDMEKILTNFAFNFTDENATIKAIKDVYNNLEHTKADKIIPFSSEKKYSGIVIDGITYILGAFDYLLEDKNEAFKYSKDSRVLALIQKGEKNIPIGLILLKDKIRKNALRTINYFKEQGVDIKIISGDNPITVSNISKRVGIKNADKYIDASELITDKDYEKIGKYTIFGRVKPEQKKKIIKAFQKNGHTVGYTGDGVNDVLALKEADCSITFQNGSEAARNVSNLILLDSDFSSIPKVVYEGRRTINNIQRSSSLFLVKTIYSFLLSIIFLFINTSYPFIPIQLTLTSVVTIGIPSFVLALEPNNEKVSGMFFTNVMSKSLPAALTIVGNIIMTIFINRFLHFTEDEVSTICVILTGLTGFIFLYRISKPLNVLRISLLITMIFVFIFGILGLRNIFELTLITPYMGLLILILTVVSYILFNLMMNITEKYILPKIRERVA